MLSVENERAPSLDLTLDCLLLDIDGTVLDIAPTPEAVIVPPPVVESIGRLSAMTSGAVAFVSGRTVETIDALFKPLKLPAVGCHGAEWRLSPFGEMQRVAMLDETVKKCVSDIVCIAPGVRIEDKGYTIAVHYRLAPEAGPAVLRALMERHQWFASRELMIMKGREAFEIKPRWFNKGTGMRHLMQAAPFTGRRPVFLGDDTTDEDVFRALPDFEGIGYSVGRRIDGADYTFTSPGDVRAWLSTLAED